MGKGEGDGGGGTGTKIEYELIRVETVKGVLDPRL